VQGNYEIPANAAKGEEEGVVVQIITLG